MHFFDSLNGVWKENFKFDWSSIFFDEQNTAPSEQLPEIDKVVSDALQLVSQRLKTDAVLANRAEFIRRVHADFLCDYSLYENFPYLFCLTKIFEEKLEKYLTDEFPFITLSKKQTLLPVTIDVYKDEKKQIFTYIKVVNLFDDFRNNKKKLFSCGILLSSNQEAQVILRARTVINYANFESAAREAFYLKLFKNKKNIINTIALGYTLRLPLTNNGNHLTRQIIWMPFYRKFGLNDEALNFLVRIADNAAKLEKEELTFEACNMEIKKYLNFVDTAFLNVLDALKTVHQAYVVHGDIKLENIVCDIDCNNEYRIALIDFGMADQKEKMVKSRGTPIYLAPELVSDVVSGEFKSKCNPSWDLWALGVSFYNLYSSLFETEKTQQLDFGKYNLPWQVWLTPGKDQSAPPPETMKKTLDAMSQLRFDQLKEKVPLNLRGRLEIVFKLLSYDPEKRPSAEQAYLELKKIIDAKNNNDAMD